jgi:DNA repair protein RecN (Recombination protein N)
MLISLHVKNFAIIDEVWLEFGEGFNVLTGETGAGKSILIGSLGVVLGNKTTKDMLGNRGDYALVELTFDSESPEIKRILEENDLICEDEIIISRRITSGGRSVCRINGEVVTQSVLKEVATYLIDIHGQHEHQSLIHKASQKKIVDSFSENAEVLLKEVRDAYHAYNAALNEYKNASGAGRKTDRELELIKYELEEIEGAAFKKGEDSELEERFKILSNADKISQGLDTAALALTDGEDNISDQLDMALKAIGRISDLDEQISGFLDNLNVISDQVSELSADIHSLAEGISGNAEEFTEVGERLDILNRLKAKYGGSYEAVRKYAEEAEKTLDSYADYDIYLDGLLKNAEKLEKVLLEKCSALTIVRQKTAKELADKIEAALYDLNFEYAKFDIRLEPLEKPSETGAEDIEFYMSTNLGQPVKKLSQCASGGELSRVMLAIKSVIADNNTIDALVFDEIDVGISGRTAQKVSEKMSSLAAKHQVICITHLPQIAAMADTHFLIEKNQDNGETTTTINRLPEGSEAGELARMLGGTTITESVLKNAAEMKKLANEWKVANR